MWFWISFVILGMLVYLPIGALFVCLVVVPLEVCFSKRGDLSEFTVPIAVVLLSVAAILFHGGLFGWYDKIEKPDEIIVSVDSEVVNDFYKREDHDGKVYLTVTDKNFSETTKSHLIDNGYIRFKVGNENAKKERANLVFTVKINGKEYKRDDLPAGTETPLFGDAFALPFGETTVEVTAKNDLGEVAKTVVVNKLRVESECAKAENAEVRLCKKFAAANLADAEEKANAKASAESGGPASQNTYVYTAGDDSLKGSDNTANCDYVKNGKCWDEVIEQADEDGWGDAYYYGDDFGKVLLYRGCEGECADIYDDAYWTARDNGRNSKRW